MTQNSTPVPTLADLLVAYTDADGNLDGRAPATVLALAELLELNQLCNTAAAENNAIAGQPKLQAATLLAQCLGHARTVTSQQNTFSSQAMFDHIVTVFEEMVTRDKGGIVGFASAPGDPLGPIVPGDGPDLSADGGDGANPVDPGTAKKPAAKKTAAKRTRKPAAKKTAKSGAK